MSKQDYYETLGVERNADEKVLKGAFRKMAMKFHPDRNPNDAQAEQRFKEVNEAYEALKDPNSRAAYDQYGHAAFENGGPGAQGGFGPDMAGSMSDIFEEFFGGRGNRRSGGRGQQRGGDLRFNLEIDLADAFVGRAVEIEVPSSAKCGTCSGSGAKPGTSPSSCGTCGGAGRVRASQGFFTLERTCPTCSGSGEVIKTPCEKCHGAGVTRQNRALSVNIPAGIDDGTRIRLAGEGDAARGSSSPGDLYIFISIRPHDFFTRDGADLFSQVPIPMATAALGGTLDVPSIDGNKSRVRVPEGSQGGRQFRLRGKGMPVMRSRQTGDLYIQIMVETPQNLSSRQRELMEEFQNISTEENNPEAEGFFTRVKDFFENIGR